MLLATSTSEAEKSERQVHVNGHDYTLREYVGAMPLRGRYVDGNESNDNGLPQGFLVYQPPGSVKDGLSPTRGTLPPRGTLPCRSYSPFLRRTAATVPVKSSPR